MFSVWYQGGGVGALSPPGTFLRIIAGRLQITESKLDALQTLFKDENGEAFSLMAGLWGSRELETLSPCME